MPKVAIVSTNKELVRFFELELEMCGYTSVVFKNFSAVVGNNNLTIVDIDTVKLSENADYAHNIVKISSLITEFHNSEECILPWPTEIGDIKRLLSDMGNDGLPKIVSNEDDENTDKNEIYVSDRENLTVVIGNRSVRLSKTELAVLEVLCAAGGNTVGREKIMRMLGAEHTNLADVYICHLRKKLEAPMGKRLIFTERGVGYYTTMKML